MLKYKIKILAIEWRLEYLSASSCTNNLAEISFLISLLICDDLFLIIEYC